jgi:hypothetical protein
LGASPINVDITSQVTGGGDVSGDTVNCDRFSVHAWLFVDTDSIIDTGTSQFTIIGTFTNDTTSPLGPLYDGSFQVLRGVTAQIGGSNTDLYIYDNAAVIPEPSTWVLGLLGLFGAGLRRLEVENMVADFRF